MGIQLHDIIIFGGIAVALLMIDRRLSSLEEYVRPFMKDVWSLMTILHRKEIVKAKELMAVTIDEAEEYAHEREGSCQCSKCRARRGEVDERKARMTKNIEKIETIVKNMKNNKKE